MKRPPWAHSVLVNFHFCFTTGETSWITWWRYRTLRINSCRTLCVASSAKRNHRTTEGATCSVWSTSSPIASVNAIPNSGFQKVHYDLLEPSVNAIPNSGFQKVHYGILEPVNAIPSSGFQKVHYGILEPVNAIPSSGFQKVHYGILEPVNAIPSSGFQKVHYGILEPVNAIPSSGFLKVLLLPTSLLCRKVMFTVVSVCSSVCPLWDSPCDRDLTPHITWGAPRDVQTCSLGDPPNPPNPTLPEPVDK